MTFNSFMTKLNKDYYEFSLRSFESELRGSSVRPYKAKYKDFQIKAP